jgi:hypothetical protein
MLRGRATWSLTEDGVAKVENRTTPKISRKSIFGRFYQIATSKPSRHRTFAEVSMQSCLIGAPQLAEWMKQHPAERLAAWRCVLGKQDGRGI